MAVRPLEMSLPETVPLKTIADIMEVQCLMVLRWIVSSSITLQIMEAQSITDLPQIAALKTILQDMVVHCIEAMQAVPISHITMQLMMVVPSIMLWSPIAYLKITLQKMVGQ